METALATHPVSTDREERTVVRAKHYDLDKSSVTLPQMRIESCGLTVDLSNRSRNWKERKRFKTSKGKSSKKSSRARNEIKSEAERSRDASDSGDVRTKGERKLSLPSLDEEELGPTADYVRSMKIGQMPSPSFIDMEEFYRDMMSALAPPNILPKSFQSKVIGKPNVGVTTPRLSNQPPPSVNIHKPQHRDLFINTDTFQPRSSHEVSILSHLASKRRSEMEEARQLLSTEPFQGYSSRENSANISTTQLKRMAEVLELSEPNSFKTTKPPAAAKSTSIPPISEFFRKRSPKKPKVVMEQYPIDMEQYNGTRSSSTDDEAQIKQSKQSKILTQKHASENAKDCSTCPLCLMFGKPSKKPSCPPNSPLTLK